MRARFFRIAGLIEEFGPANVGMPHIRSLGRKLWEVRVSGRDGIARGIYVLAVGNKIIVLNVFIKKTQQTPEKNLRLAIQRAIKARLL
jgi:phage-related protein